MTARRTRGRPARGILWIVAVLFAGSAAIRLAEAASTFAGDRNAEGSEIAQMPLAPPQCEGAEVLAPLLEEVRAQSKALDERDAALTERAANIADAEARLADTLRRLAAEKDELARRLAIADTAAEDDLDRLTGLYENMKPKDAARLFEVMTPEFAAGFLGRMRAESAAAILAGLAPERAHIVSLVIAGRNSGAAGTEETGR